MKVNELICKLEDIKDRYGDVIICDLELDDYIVEYIGKDGLPHPLLPEKSKKSKWHSVKNRLPEPMKFKLLADKYGNIHVGYTYSNGTSWFTEYGHKLFNITHWREEPKPPK